MSGLRRGELGFAAAAPLVQRSPHSLDEDDGDFQMSQDPDRPPHYRHPSPGPGQGIPLEPPLAQDQHCRLVLNVGGSRFETTRSTLLRCPDSFFGSLLSGKFLAVSPDGSVFIDRDSDRFRHVLNFLRNGSVHVDSLSEARGLLEEAEFFQLGAMVKVLDQRIDELESKQYQAEVRNANILQTLQALQASQNNNSNAKGATPRKRRAFPATPEPQHGAAHAAPTLQQQQLIFSPSIFHNADF